MVFHFAAMPAASRVDSVLYVFTRYGWSGVDLFFVLSGFLITGILVDSRGTKHYFRNFYARRALRIMPLYCGFVAVLLLIYPRVGGPEVANEAAVLQQNQAWIWTHTVNWLVARTGNFLTATPLATGGFWSLSIEEQFYLVWPVVVLLTPRRHLLRLCISLIAAAALTRFVMVAAGASWAAIFTVTFARMDAIAMGAAIAVVVRSAGGLSAIRQLALVVGAIALLALGAGEILSRTSLAPGANLALAIRCTLFVWLWGALVVATLTASPGGVLHRVTHTRILQTFGLYSYALYLFHGHMDRLARSIGFDPRGGVAAGGTVLPRQLAYLAVATAVSLGLAWSSWHLFEKQFLKLKVFFPSHTLTADLRGRAGGLHVGPGTSASVPMAADQTDRVSATTRDSA
jgi:peptidoglycan/LPS O-acetylase OafA/YrhL